MSWLKTYRSKKNKSLVYDGIETLPVFNWFKISETNDLTYLCIDKDKKPDEIYLQSLWNKITFEFIDCFGVSSQMKQVLETQRKILLLETRVILENRKDLNALIELEKVKLEKISKTENEKKVNTILPFVSKNMGFQIDTKKISTKEFFEYVKMIESQIKEQQRAHKKNAK